MKRLFLIPLFGALVLVLGGYLMEGGNVLHLFQISACVLTYGLTFVLLLTQFSPSEMGKAFSVAATGGSSKELKTALTFFETMQRLAIVSGIFGPVLATVHVGAYTQTIAQFAGGTFALMLVASLYSLSIILFISIPFSGAIKKRMVE